MLPWIYGVLLALLSLLGLLVASRAHDGMFYTVGLLFFAFGVAFIFGLIVKNTGHTSAPADH
jgi:hypothetical protein